MFGGIVIVAFGGSVVVPVDRAAPEPVALPFLLTVCMLAPVESTPSAPAEVAFLPAACVGATVWTEILVEINVIVGSVLSDNPSAPRP